MSMEMVTQKQHVLRVRWAQDHLARTEPAFENLRPGPGVDFTLPMSAWPPSLWTCSTLRAAVPQAPQRFDLGCVGAQQSCRGGRLRVSISAVAVSSRKCSKEPKSLRKSRAFWRSVAGARHLVGCRVAINERVTAPNG